MKKLMNELTGCLIISVLAAVGILVAGFLAFRNYGDRKEIPLQITNLSTSAEPQIGRVVKLRVKVKSIYDASNAEITIGLPAGVKLVKGDLVWRGEMAANRTETHEVSVCVMSEGDWQIEAQARTWWKDYNDPMYYDNKAIQFNSTKISGDGICP